MVSFHTLMMEYMMGWVNIGSSISLWPNFLYPTRSMTTSLGKRMLTFQAEEKIGRKNLCQVERHSAARLATMMHASGSSAFTWKIGAFTTRPTSVQ